MVPLPLFFLPSPLKKLCLSNIYPTSFAIPQPFFVIFGLLHLFFLRSIYSRFRENYGDYFSLRYASMHSLTCNIYFSILFCSFIACAILWYEYICICFRGTLIFFRYLCLRFLSATEYHSDADYNSRRVGVVVVVVVVVSFFKKWITFLCFDRFG